MLYVQAGGGVVADSDPDRGIRGDGAQIPRPSPARPRRPGASLSGGVGRTIRTKRDTPMATDAFPLAEQARVRKGCR